jgi:hypothetical protein
MAVNLGLAVVVINGQYFNVFKDNYPVQPTVMGGVSISFGADSCIEHPEPTRASLPLWIPKTHLTYIPSLGQTVTINLTRADPLPAPFVSTPVFNGRIESIELEDDHDPAGGYKLRVVAADTLAQAAKERLSDIPWPYETVANRLSRIAVLASNSGVQFAPTSTNGDYALESTSLDSQVTPRDTDSFPALEAFQRAAMAIGATVGSIGGVVRPNNKLELPAVLDFDYTGVTKLYWWSSTPHASRTDYKISGVTNRTNWATNPSGVSSTNYSIVAGTGGAGTIASGSTGNPYFFKGGSANHVITATWTTAATGGNPGIKYRENTTAAGATGSKISAGVWVLTPVIGRSAKLQVNLWSGASIRGTGLSAAVSLTAGVWTWLNMDNVTATGAFDDVEVIVQLQSGTSINEYLIMDGVLIEKTTAVGTYFDGDTKDVSVNIIAAENSDVIEIDSSEIVDDTYQLDTSKVINEIKVEAKKLVGTTTPVLQDADQVFSDQIGKIKTTPQSRSIESDWCQQVVLATDPFSTASILMTKGKLLLAGQSLTQWRLSSGITPVFKIMAPDTELDNLINESTRFGALIKIANAPAFAPQFVRVHAGTITINGEYDTEVSLEVEPVEYSAPTPLTKNSSDSIARSMRFKNFHTLTARQLRAIGAR